LKIERDYIVRILRETGGVVSTTATRLGMPRTTLNAMMKNLGISHADLRASQALNSADQHENQNDRR